jgi:hypothetical protein
MQNQRAEFREYEYKIQVAGAALFLCDDNARFDAAELWSDISDQQALVAGDGVLSVRAEPDSSVRLLVDVREVEQLDPDAGFHPIGRCLLDVPSGLIVVAGSADFYGDAARIPVRPALYQVAVYAGSLDTIYSGLRRSQNCLKVVLSLC